MAKKAKPQTLQLELIRPCCAAIDVGSMLMVVSYSDANGNQYLLETDAFTESLLQLAKTLADAGVKEVAMEATGSYWMALYQILEQHGFNVILVNPRHFKNVDGQKTDINDSQWLHQLHAYGLLRASHIPQEKYRELKSYMHERGLLQQQKSDTLNRIQRLLTEMNIKVQHLISDIEGVAGMILLQSIAAGISDPETLLASINVNSLKATEEDLLKSLKGNYRPQFIKILRHQLKALDFFKLQMKEYELLIEEVLVKMLPENKSKKDIKEKKELVRKNQYSINVKEYMAHISGVDLTQIDGLNEINVLEIISVTGLDMSKWKTSDHFTSWLNLSPRHKKSGGKIIGHEKRISRNNATHAFRIAAQTMWQNKGALGQLYKRLSAQRGTRKAIKAVARKIAVIFYHVLKTKKSFDKEKLKTDTARQEAKKLAFLKKEAAKYGYHLQNIAA